MSWLTTEHYSLLCNQVFSGNLKLWFHCLLLLLLILSHFIFIHVDDFSKKKIQGQSVNHGSRCGNFIYSSTEHDAALFLLSNHQLDGINRTPQ